MAQRVLDRLNAGDQRGAQEELVLGGGLGNLANITNQGISAQPYQYPQNYQFTALGGSFNQFKPQKAQAVNPMVQEARTHLAKGRATADEVLGVERISRVKENEALVIERKAEAEKDHMSAVLDMVKAMKELEGIDIAHLQQIIQLAKVVRAEEAQMAIQPTTLQNNTPSAQSVSVSR